MQEELSHILKPIFLKRMYFLYKCYRDGRIIDKKNSKMTYLRMALDKGYGVAEYEYGKLLREKDPEEAKKYFKRAADKNNAYAAYAYGKMCADRGDINKAKIYFGRATRVKPELGFRVGMWYYYDLGNHEMGIDHLENAAKNGNVAAEEALNAINRGIDTRLACLL